MTGVSTRAEADWEVGIWYFWAPSAAFQTPSYAITRTRLRTSRLSASVDEGLPIWRGRGDGVDVGQDGRLG